jgi:non-specific serine/threonine protein kinase
MSLQQAAGYALSLESTLPTAAGEFSQTETRVRSSSLTPREREVALLVAQGLTNRRISEELSISERTVATHVARSLKKLGLGSRSRLAAWITAEEQSPPDPT